MQPQPSKPRKAGSYRLRGVWGQVCTAKHAWIRSATTRLLPFGGLGTPPERLPRPGRCGPLPPGGQSGWWRRACGRGCVEPGGGDSTASSPLPAPRRGRYRRAVAPPPGRHCRACRTELRISLVSPRERSRATGLTRLPTTQLASPHGPGPFCACPRSLARWLDEQAGAPVASTQQRGPSTGSRLCFVAPRVQGPQTLHLPTTPTPREKWT